MRDYSNVNIPSKFLNEMRNISPYTVKLYIALHHFAKLSFEPFTWFKHQEFMELTGISRNRLKKSFNELEQLGLITSYKDLINGGEVTMYQMRG